MPAVASKGLLRSLLVKKVELELPLERYKNVDDIHRAMFNYCASLGKARLLTGKETESEQS